jgi:hypothetical protein
MEFIRFFAGKYHYDGYILHQFKNMSKIRILKLDQREISVPEFLN